MANDFLLSILIQAKDAASQTVKAVGEAVRSLGGEAATATKGVGELDTATAEASGSVSRLGLSVGLWTEAVNAGVNAVRSLVTELRNFVVGVVNTTDRFEGLTNALDTITKGHGAETFKELNDWAKKMPLSTEEAIQAYIRLKTMGLDPTVETMTTLVDTTGALGGSVDIFNRITLALGQAATKGRLMGEEVRQFAEAGIPIYDILREKLQLAQEQMRQIGQEGIDAFTAIPAIIEGMVERFGGQASKMQQQWSGLKETLESIWKDFARQIGDAGFLDYLKQKAREVQAALEEMAETGELQIWAQTISDIFTGTAKAAEYTISVLARVGRSLVGIIAFLDEFRLAWQLLLTVLAAPYLEAAILGIVGALGKLSAALATFALAHPVLAGIAAAIAAVSVAMGLLADTSEETAQSAGKTREALDKELKSLEDLQSRLLATKQGTDDHVAAEQELARVLPEANISLDEHGRMLAKVTGLQDENAQKLRELIELKKQESEAWLGVQIERTATALENATEKLADYTDNMREWYGVGEASKDWAAEFWTWLNRLTGTYDENIKRGEEYRANLGRIGKQYQELLEHARKAGLSVEDMSRLLDQAGASGTVKSEVLTSYRQLVGVLDEAGQAARRQAQVAESAGAQAYDRMAQKAQDTYSKKAEAARTAHNAEVENIGKLKLTEDEEAAKRLAADGAFHSSRLAGARAHYQALADQLAGFFSRGEITQAEYQSRLGALERQYNTEYGNILAERQEILRVRLAEAEKAYDAHLAKINALENAQLSDALRRESALADIRQRGMDETGRDRDNLARINALLAESEQALAKATELSGKEREQALEQARMYAEQAAGLSGRLSDTAVATQAVNASFDQLSRIKGTALGDLEADAAASKQNLESLRAEMGNLQATIKALASQTVTLTLDPTVTERVAGLRQDLEAAAEDVTITVAADTETAKTNIAALNEIETTSPHTVTDNATDVLAEIRSLDGQNTESTHTIYVQRVEANAAGGLIGEVARFAAGGWHRVAGLLPGYGGGDRRPAILEDGEFVVNKSTVRLFGPDLFYSLQDAARSGLGALRDQVRGALRVPGFSLGGLASARIREATRPVLSLASGGLVPASATAMPDLGRVVLEIGGADVPAYMSADMLKNLENALRRAKLTRKL